MTSLLLLLSSAALAANIQLTVLHTNDIHGAIFPRPDRKETARMVGGAGALAKAVARNTQPGRTLLLDGGDWFQGTPEGSLTRGRPLVELFNALKYDGVAIGNHEFDMGEAELKALAAGLKVPVLAANLYLAGKDERPAYVRPFIIKKVGKIKVGVFGLLTTRMPELAFEKNIAGLRFADEVETAKETVSELKAAGADVIIALTHIGLEDKGRPFGDETLAAKAPGIDLIIGAHSHTYLFEPRVVGETLIVQSGANLTHLGRAVLEIDPSSRKVVSKKGELLKLWVDELGEDEAMKAMTRKYQDEVGRSLDVVIGSSTVSIVRARDRESGMGDWMTDCLRKWSKTQIAFQNGGGVRTDILAGPVTLRTVFEVMPFDNYLVTLNMTGGQVKQIFERGVAGGIGMIQLSGARFTYDPAAPAMSRVRDAFVGKEPLRENEVYSVSAPDFIVQGGDSYDAFAEGKDKAYNPVLVRDVLGWCVRETSPLAQPEGGRITAATAQ
ncbi:MAG: bifunctional UDP-sugar hydrolase/5'-nucleotidase [Elusimicrobiota bacterium]